MAKYKKKPVVIDAWKWEGKNLADAQRFTQMNGMPDFSVGSRNGMTGLIIPTLEGDHVAQKGDYIICGVAGEYYPYKLDIFEATYEEFSMSELEQLKIRIDKSGDEGVLNSHIREDYNPVGDIMIRNLTDSGEYIQRKTPMHSFDAKWRIFKKGNEPY